MNVEVTFPAEFDERVNKYLFDKHAEIDEVESDNIVSVIKIWRGLIGQVSPGVTVLNS